MITELAILDVKTGLETEFENAFSEAQNIISSMTGYQRHQLQKCIEKNNRYMLIVHWCKLEDHTQGFRQSPEYQEWRNLLHHFYDPFPNVEHYELLFASNELNQ